MQLYSQCRRFYCRTLLVGVWLGFSSACATHSVQETVPAVENEKVVEVSPVERKAPCIDKKNKVLVYPPNDGFGFSRDQNASGKPTEYCDEDELLKKRVNLHGIKNSNYAYAKSGKLPSGVGIRSGGKEEAYSGAIDREAVRRVFRSSHNRLKTCFGKNSHEGKSPIKMLIQLKLDSKGKVTAAAVKNPSRPNKSLEDCVVSKTSDVRFPSPADQGGIDIEFPVAFYFQHPDGVLEVTLETIVTGQERLISFYEPSLEVLKDLGLNRMEEIVKSCEKLELASSERSGRMILEFQSQSNGEYRLQKTQIEGTSKALGNCIESAIRRNES